MARGVPNDPSKTAVAKVSPSKLQIDGIDDLYKLANLLFKGGAASMQNIDRPEKVFTILLHGLEIGLAPTQALACIMMLPNGRCSIWGDGLLALVRASGLLAKDLCETLAGDGDDRTATCLVQRVGEPERRFTFSLAEAKKAGLIQKSLGKDGKGQGPWVTYPDRMLKMRARGFALRDVFPDVLKGLVTTEEAQDYLDAETAAPRVVQATDPGANILPAMQRNLEGVIADLDKRIAAGQATAALPAAPISPPTEVSNDGPPTTAQMEQIAWVRKCVIAARSLTDPADQAAAWKETLAPYGVESAKQFTHEKAAMFLAGEAPKHDPFTHPPA